MNITRILAVAAALSLVAACGGSGGSSPAPTPTSEGTKAVAAASQALATQGFGDAMDSGMQNLAPVANVAADVSPTKAGTNYSGAINATKQCNGGGSYTATGTLTAVCTGDPSTEWSCTDFVAQNLVIAFADCQVSVTQGATTYDEVVTGNTSGTITSSAVAGNGQTFTSVSLTGTLSGTPALTGTVEGTVDLGSTTFEIALVDAQPVTTCAGTCSVTIEGTAQTCTVNTTCDGCTL